MIYSHRVVDAMALMYELHCEQVRKGSEVPYITHLLATAALVGHHGGDEDQFIAALLHDAAEDQGGAATLDRIRRQFGATVADYVEGCSDSMGDPRPPWRERKERYVEKKRTAAAKLKLITAADKLHNARSILSDLKAQGTSLWDRFKGGRDGSLWYYPAVLDALSNNWAHPILEELAEVIAAVETADQRLREDTQGLGSP